MGYYEDVIDASRKAAKTHWGDPDLGQDMLHTLASLAEITSDICRVPIERVIQDAGMLANLFRLKKAMPDHAETPIAGPGTAPAPRPQGTHRAPHHAGTHRHSGNHDTPQR